MPSSQLKRLQVIQNSLARAVAHTPLRQPVTPVLKSLHWLKVKQRIHYKLVSITHNPLHNSQPVYLRRLISIHNPTNTRSASYLRLQTPKVTSRIKFHDRTFSTAAPKLWNSLPQSLRSFNENITLPHSSFSQTHPISSAVSQTTQDASFHPLLSTMSSSSFHATILDSTRK